MEEKIDILLFDEEETTHILVESYLKDLTFQYSFHKFKEFNETILNGRNPQIILFGLSENNLSVLNKVHHFAVNKNLTFIAISYNKNADIHVKAIRAGAKDFLFKPLIKNDVLNSLQKIYNNSKQNKTGQKKCTVSTVVSAEEGIGKTFFVLNLAKEVADQSKENVLLIDFNNNLNDLSSRVNMNFTYSTSFVISKSNEETFDFKKYINRYPNSEYLYILANGVFYSNKIQETQNIGTFIKKIRSTFKYVFIDITPEKNETNNEISENTDIIYNILLPTVNSSISAKKLTNEKFSKNHVRYILNKFNKAKDEEYLKRIESIIEKPLFIKIPLNYIATNTSITHSKTLKEVSPQVDIVKKYEKLAEFIINRD